MVQNMNDTSKKNSRGRPKKLTAAQITDVAMHAYWNDGPTRVSLNEVCQRAGASKPSVYREFGNDDGLMHAALLHYANDVLKTLTQIATAEDRFAEKLEKLVSLAAEDPLHAQGCLFVKMRAEKSSMGPNTQALIDEMDAAGLQTFTTLLQSARASGEWPSEMPLALGAQYLHSQIGLALDQRARGIDPKATLGLALSIFDVTTPA